MSIEEKYDEVRQLINIGKEKGYLLYDEVNELLPADITSSEELDDLFNTFGSAGIEVVDSEQNYRDDKLLDRTGEGAEELELDLTPGALDKTNDPVRMYLREMGTVPLLTREGEVEIAKRIERGKLAVIKSISRTPIVAQEGHRRWASSSSAASARSASSSSSTTKRSPTSASRSARSEVQKQIDAVRKALAGRREAEREADGHAEGRRPRATSASTAARDGRRCARGSSCRSSSARSSSPRSVKRRLIDEMKERRRGGAARAARDRRHRTAAQSRRTSKHEAQGRGAQERSSGSRRICAAA